MRYYTAKSEDSYNYMNHYNLQSYLGVQSHGGVLLLYRHLLYTMIGTYNINYNNMYDKCTFIQLIIYYMNRNRIHTYTLCLYPYIKM